MSAATEATCAILVVLVTSSRFLIGAPLLWSMWSSLHPLKSASKNISFTKLNISFTELVFPSVNSLLEGKMALSTNYVSMYFFF